MLSQKPLQGEEATSSHLPPIERGARLSEAPPKLVVAPELRKLLRRLPRHSLLRSVVNVQTGEFEDNQATQQRVFRVLQEAGEARWREVTLATHLASRLSMTVGEKAIIATPLQRILDNEVTAQKYRSAYRFGRLLRRTASLAAIMTMIAMGAQMHRGSFLQWSVLVLPVLLAVVVALWTVCFSPLLAPFSVAWDMYNAHRMRYEVIKALGALKVPESVGTLAKAATFSSVPLKTHRAAKEALLATLPELTPEHYGQLSYETTPNLCELIGAYLDKLHTPNRGEARHFIVSLLDALEKAGASYAIPFVQFLTTDPGVDAEMQAQTKRILAVLLQRKREVETASTLLRGASAPAATPDTLLRAAAPQETTVPTEQLLRPTDAPSEKK